MGDHNEETYSDSGCDVRGAGFGERWCIWRRYLESAQVSEGATLGQRHEDVHAKLRHCARFMLINPNEESIAVSIEKIYRTAVIVVRISLNDIWEQRGLYL